MSQVVVPQEDTGEDLAIKVPTGRVIAVYAGTFDPITNGHLDIVKRSAQIFGELVVGVAESSKMSVLFPVEERVRLVEESLPDSISSVVRVQKFSGLLVNFVRSLGGTVIIRGLRAVSDYEYESQIAMTNRQLSKGVETFFMMTSKEYSFVSSSIVKEVSRLGGDVSDLVPALVEKRLREVYRT